MVKFSNVYIPDGEVIITLQGCFLDTLSNFLPSDLSPNCLWEPGRVLEDDNIYQAYSEQFSLKFPALCQVGLKELHANVCVSESYYFVELMFSLLQMDSPGAAATAVEAATSKRKYLLEQDLQRAHALVD